MNTPWLSIIIPAYREQSNIGALLSHVAELPAPGGMEVLVADGDPERSTLAAIPFGAAIPLPTEKGRARQMNAGARAARGDILLFLHADTRLPPDAFTLIKTALDDPRACGGAFSLAIQPKEGEPGPGLRLIAWAANQRTRLTRRFTP